MSSSALKSLSNHSVFRGTSIKSDGNEYNHNSKKIVSRGDEELFIANGKTIRCCDISSNKNDYKILKLDDIKADIHKISINDSGTLLAAYNDNELVVCSLPSPGFMDNFEEDSINARSYRVGGAIFNESNKILELFWSSIARYDSELIILSTDSCIRTFDLTISAETSQFEINLAKNSTGLGLTNNIANPVSISVGSTNQENPSQCLTLYILSGDGDIYALYPFVPTCLTVTEDFVKKLFDQTTLYLRDTETELTRLELLQQLKFVSALYKDLDKAQKEIKLDIEGNMEQFYHLTPPSVKESLKVQGPFSITPFPSVLYNYDGCEIDHVPCGNTDIIATSWSNGSCLLLFQDLELIMRWNHQFDQISGLDIDEDDYSFESGRELTLSTLEYIPLTQNDSSSIKFAGSSQLLPYQLFVVVGDSSLIKIDFTQWGKKLDSSIKTDSPDEFIDAISETLTSKLTLLSDGPYDEGFAALQFDDNTYIIKLGSQNVDVIELVASDETATTNPGIKLKSDLLDLKREDFSQRPQHGSLLSGPYLEIFELIKEAKHPEAITSAFDTDTSARLSFDDEGSLKDLLKVSNYVVNQRMALLHRLGINLHYRIKMQHKELKSQISILVNEYGNEQTDARRAKVVDLKNRIENLGEKQESSVKRLDALLENLNKLLKEQDSKSKNLLVSKEEQSWFNQLEHLEKELSKLKEKFGDYNGQLKFINNIIHTNGINSTGAALSTGKKANYFKVKEKILREKKLVNLVERALSDDIMEVDKLMADMSI